MIKKLLLLFYLSCIAFSLSSCTSKDSNEVKKDFQQGDQITVNGIIYTYYTAETMLDDVIPFKEEEQYKPYYNYYYYDMSDFKNSPEIDASFNGKIECLGLHAGEGEHMFYPETFYRFLKYSEPNYSPTSAYFFRLRDYFTYSLSESCFIVTGYTEDLKEEVVIPSKIEDIPITHVGFKAFEKAPMKTFTFYSGDASPASYTLMHPYAISNCPNLEEIKTDAKVLSMGISNCNKLKSIDYIGLVSDCSLYNLPNLYSLNDCDARPYFNKKTILEDIVFLHNTSGIRRSSIYLCPNLYHISGYPLTQKDGIVYYDNTYPYYAYYDTFSLTLKDEYFSNLSYHSYQCITYNQATMELYLPFLNQGLNYSGTIEVDKDSKLIVQEEDGFYVSVAFPKMIIKGQTQYSNEYEEPILLKINLGR